METEWPSLLSRPPAHLRRWPLQRLSSTRRSSPVAGHPCVQFVGCATAAPCGTLVFRYRLQPNSSRGQDMSNPIGELKPPVRLMMTPGPSSIDPRVYRALATQLVGHMDPWFRTCMDETQTLLR